MEDDAISAVVNRLIENPQYFAVSANVVNNPALSWVHYSMGVYEAFWPVNHPPFSPPGPAQPGQISLTLRAFLGTTKTRERRSLLVAPVHSAVLHGPSRRPSRLRHWRRHPGAL